MTIYDDPTDKREYTPNPPAWLGIILLVAVFIGGLLLGVLFDATVPIHPSTPNATLQGDGVQIKRVEDPERGVTCYIYELGVSCVPSNLGDIQP